MQFRLRTLLLLFAAVPIWAYTIVIVSQSTGFGAGPVRYLIAPIVLSGIAAACFWLLRGSRDGLAWSLFLSPIIALGSLLVVSSVLS
jgi:hypothetical protein